LPVYFCEVKLIRRNVDIRRGRSVHQLFVSAINGAHLANPQCEHSERRTQASSALGIISSQIFCLR